ncbi:hypothetical protein QPK87_32195 [Kamptonema cortianum]|nr:hypothetical protein [Geitlerinema splendidum]MDK3161185.1 hypothetical protein [Kamptonema cortianum]
MNLYDFFHSAAYRYLGRNTLTPDEVTQLPRCIKLLTQGFGGSTAIDYSNRITKLAYMFSYAPKHAIIWRECAHNFLEIPDHGKIEFNSFGTACGPEIIGLMEGPALPKGSVLSVHCLDSDTGWYPMLTAVIEEYTFRTNKSLQVQFGGLAKGKDVLGSFILSELVKQGTHQGFNTSFKNQIGRCKGLFLDIPKCRLADGTEPFLSEVFKLGFWNFTRHDVQLKDIINAEMNSCQGCYCLNQLTSEPKLNFYFPKFE